MAVSDIRMLPRMPFRDKAFFPCQSYRHSLSFTQKANSMKGDVGKPARPSSGNGTLLMATLLLMFPSSASMLCIAPGGHVAIEDINALCCAPFSASAPDESHGINSFGSPDKCSNCTDIFLTPNGRAPASKSYRSAAAGYHAGECLGNQLSAVTCFSQCLPDIPYSYVDTSPPMTALIPMRR
jgi:hypothetical protein